MYSEQLVQGLAPMDWLFPASLGVGTYVTAVGISMSPFKRAKWTILIGLGGGTVTAFLQSSPTSTFSTVHTLANSTVIATGPNKVVEVETPDDQVTFQFSTDVWVRLNLTISGSALLIAVLGQGGDADQKPAQQQVNTAVVVQQLCIGN